MKLNPASEAKLSKVHPDLVRVIRRAASITTEKGFEWIVTCGIRTLDEQKRLMKIGATRTMRSRHLPGARNKLSHAVDLAVKIDGKVRWDWPLYSKLATIVKRAAREEAVPIEWGGDWRSFKDGPHYQLPWAKYPG